MQKSKLCGFHDGKKNTLGLVQYYCMQKNLYTPLVIHVVFCISEHFTNNSSD